MVQKNSHSRRAGKPGAGILVKRLSLVTCMVGAAFVARSADAMVITPIFDSSITSLSNAATVEAAFNTVANDYATSFSSPATVYIGVSWGSVDGYALPSNAVGASVDPLYGYFNYSQIRSYFTNAAAANPTDTALTTFVANMPATAPSGPKRYVIPAAETKALGLVSGSNTSKDGYIGFAGNSATGFDYNPTDGITSGTFDFRAVAAHEIDEVLGRISGLTSSNSTYRTPFDLMRYGAPGSLSFSYNAAAYFSINGGRTNLGNFNNSPYGGDRSDWLTLTGSSDIQDAFISTGQNLNLTATDLTGLDALGWAGVNAGDNGSSPTSIVFNLVEDFPSASVPEPAALGILAIGLALAGSLRRRPAIA